MSATETVTVTKRWKDGTRTTEQREVTGWHLGLDRTHCEVQYDADTEMLCFVAGQRVSDVLEVTAKR